MSLVSNILMANTLYKQVQSTYSVQTSIHNQTEMLAVEIKLDAARGQNVAKKQDQLNDMVQQENKANQMLGKNLKDEQEVINKISKEKDTGSVSRQNVTGKDAETLKRIKQDLSSKIARLQMDDATENGSDIQKLQQDLETVQSQLQTIQADSGVPAPAAEAPEPTTGGDGSARNNVDIVV